MKTPISLQIVDTQKNNTQQFYHGYSAQLLHGENVWQHAFKNTNAWPRRGWKNHHHVQGLKMKVKVLYLGLTLKK